MSVAVRMSVAVGAADVWIVTLGPVSEVIAVAGVTPASSVGSDCLGVSVGAASASEKSVCPWTSSKIGATMTVVMSLVPANNIVAAVASSLAASCVVGLCGHSFLCHSTLSLHVL